MRYPIMIFITCFLFINAYPQQTFERTYPFYNGNAMCDLVFDQGDHYLMAGIGYKDKVVLSIIGTNQSGDTLWTKDHDLGPASPGTCRGTSDTGGNTYIGFQSGAGSRLVKLDQEGNVIWSKPVDRLIQNLQVSASGLWMSTQGLYLYKLDPSNGDSLWRSEIFAFEYSAVATSMVISETEDVLLTVSFINGYTGWPGKSDLYKLPANSGSIISTLIQTGQEIVIHDTHATGNDLFSIGSEVRNNSNPNPETWMIRYLSDGTVLGMNEFDLQYDSYGFYRFVINNEGRIVALGGVPDPDLPGNDKILLHCMTQEGDSLWTHTLGMHGFNTLGWDIKTCSNGGYLIGGSIDDEMTYTPYLAKINSSGLLTGIESLNERQMVSVYPNPASGYIVFGTSGCISGMVQICNTSGQIIREIQITEDNTRLTTVDMPDGVYFYSVISGETVSAGKFIIYH